MSEIMLILAGLFLPLFPLSMVFNGLFNRVNAKLRLALLLIWPQIGLAIAFSTGIEIPGWIIGWALLTAILYGFRALVLRELNLWVGFIATSVWSILWLVFNTEGVTLSGLAFYALGFSIPLVLLVLLSGELEKRFGAAYTGLYNGLAETMPRLSWVIALVVLAIIATPLFPSFSALLAAMLNVAGASFMLALMLALAWFIWGWAGARLIQGLLIGEDGSAAVVDMSKGKALAYGGVLLVMVYFGVCMLGGLA